MIAEYKCNICEEKFDSSLSIRTVCDKCIGELKKLDNPKLAMDIVYGIEKAQWLQ